MALFVNFVAFTTKSKNRSLDFYEFQYISCSETSSKTARSEEICGWKLSL